MRLSEAIRLGAMMKPQAFGVERGRVRRPGLRGLFQPRIETTCALAAALDAVGPLPTKEIPAAQATALRGHVSPGKTLATVFPEEWALVNLGVSCPACNGFPVPVFNLISHLNDTHRWTREQIADWVEQIELQQVSEEKQAATQGT